MFPALEQLELLVCGISDISLDYTTFTRLQVNAHVYTCIIIIVHASIVGLVRV